MNNLGYTVMP